MTLAVAAAALLPPLDRRLRHEEVRSLLDTAVAARPVFQDLDLREMRPGNEHLVKLAFALERRAGARVAVFDPAEWGPSSETKFLNQFETGEKFKHGGTEYDAVGDERPLVLAEKIRLVGA